MSLLNKQIKYVNKQVGVCFCCRRIRCIVTGSISRVSQKENNRRLRESVALQVLLLACCRRLLLCYLLISKNRLLPRLVKTCVNLIDRYLTPGEPGALGSAFVNRYDVPFIPPQHQKWVHMPFKKDKCKYLTNSSPRLSPLALASLNLSGWQISMEGSSRLS